MSVPDMMTQAEYDAYVADMEAQGEAQLEAWRMQMEQDSMVEDQMVYVDFLTMPTLCDGCPLMDAWMADQTFRAEAAYDWSVNR